MFDSDLDGKKKDYIRIGVSSRSTEQDSASPANVQRRAFLATSLATLGGLALWEWKRPRILEASSATVTPTEVTVVLFSDKGEWLQKTKVAKVIKTAEQWRRQLSPNAYDIARNADTEFAFSGAYWNVHDNGLYRCICCDNALFDSTTKFDSGTGWPSFWAPIAKENVTEIRDSSLGVVRTAVACTQCDAHLGHVFEDGPEPTGLRYCMNSASLRFVKRT